MMSLRQWQNRFAAIGSNLRLQFFNINFEVDNSLGQGWMHDASSLNVSGFNP